MNDRDVIQNVRHLLETDGPPDELRPEEYRRVVEAVRQLSNALNHERGLVTASYLDSMPHLLGYVAFFLPRSMAQFESLIPELGRAPRRVLDLGCGPGPATLAALAAGAESVHAVDHAAGALEIVAALTDERVTTRRADLQGADIGRLVADAQADTVFMGHVLNELWSETGDRELRRADLVTSVLEALPDGGRLLIVDPALRTTSRALLGVRDLVAERGWPIHAPCLRQGPCPALDDERDWCHAERSWTPSPLVARIADDVGVRHDVAKMTYFVFGTPRREDAGPARLPGRTFRIVSEPLHTKGRLRYYGCGEEGRVPLVMKERDARGDAADFADLQRGDVVTIGETITKGDGSMVKKGEVAKRTLRAGEAHPASIAPRPGDLP